MIIAFVSLCFVLLLLFFIAVEFLLSCWSERSTEEKKKIQLVARNAAALNGEK